MICANISRPWNAAACCKRSTSACARTPNSYRSCACSFAACPKRQRKAFWFRNVTDARGRSFEGSVVIGSLGSSRAIYGAALDVEPAEIPRLWARAQQQPLAPVVVEREAAPVKEVVLRAPDLGEGADAFPHLISTPGFDPAPFITGGCWITRDPETGANNLGIYRGMIKAPDRIGCATDVPTQHLAIMWEKARRMGRHLDAAIFIGGPPALVLASASKVPYGVDEFGIAGALNGAAIELVKAETSELLVPAHAEIVIEGRIRTDVLEPEAPFGEASGYLGPRKMEKIFEVTAITHRRAPVYQGIVSEFPPSESTVIRKIAFDAIYLRHLRDSCNIPSVTQSGDARDGELQHALRDPARPAGDRSAVASAARGRRVRCLARQDLHRGRRRRRSRLHGRRAVGALVQHAAASRCGDHSRQSAAARPLGLAVDRRAPADVSRRHGLIGDPDQRLPRTPVSCRCRCRGAI